MFPGSEVTTFTRLYPLYCHAFRLFYFTRQKHKLTSSCSMLCKWEKCGLELHKWEESIAQQGSKSAFLNNSANITEWGKLLENSDNMAFHSIWLLPRVNLVEQHWFMFYNEKHGHWNNNYRNYSNKKMFSKNIHSSYSRMENDQL